LLVTGCAGPEPEPRPGGWVIIDADAHGAIIFGRRDSEYRGVSRDGATVWRRRVGPPIVGCMKACPDAIPSTFDLTRTVLWAESPDNTVSVKGAELDLAGHRMRVGGQHTTWQTSADGQHALALTTLPVQGNNEARWFDLTPGGWRLSAPVVTVPGPREHACVSPDGRTALLLGAAPSLLDRDGYQMRITEIENAGACAFTRSSAIVVEPVSGAGGLSRSRLRALSPAGAVIWRLNFIGSAAVCGDVTSDRVLYVLAGVLHEAVVGLDVGQRTIPGVSAACFDGEGALVVVDPTGATYWTD
jgi:hypothetical protein